MSVPEPIRHKGRLEVHVKAQALAAHTALILKNQKVFDPEVDTELINRIRNCSYDIYAKSWAANKINAETNEINRAMRYQLQEEALLLCDQMLTRGAKSYRLRAYRCWTRSTITSKNGCG